MMIMVRTRIRRGVEGDDHDDYVNHDDHDNRDHHGHNENQEGGGLDLHHRPDKWSLGPCPVNGWSSISLFTSSS